MIPTIALTTSKTKPTFNGVINYERTVSNQACGA
jgi:hypothetical protein